MMKKFRSMLFGWPVILVVAIVNHWPLLNHIQQNGLGRDELQGTTHAILSLRSLLESVAAFDPHPPAYYLQLHFWFKLGTSDAWVKINPVFWGILASLSLYFVVRRLFDTQTAFWTGLIFTLLPTVMNYTIAVRMYAMLLFAIIWIWYFTWRWFHHSQLWISAAGMLIASLLFLYAFGASFLLFFTAPLFSTLLLMDDFPRQRQRWLLYLGLQALLVVLYLPWLLQAADITVGHTIRPGFFDIAATLTHFMFGELILQQFNSSWMLVVGVGVFIWLVVRALMRSELRSTILAFVLSPLLAAVLISVLVRPVWLTRSLIFVLPFLSLALGCQISTGWTPRSPVWERWLAIAVLVTILLSGIIFYRQFDTWRPARPVVEMVQLSGKPGDIVIIPDVRYYWGIAWYFVGPGSVNPLNTAYSLLTPDGYHLYNSGILSQIDLSQVDWIIDANPANFLSLDDLPDGYTITEQGQFTDVRLWHIQPP